MNNEKFVGNLLFFLNIVLKIVGLAPFRYIKSKRLFMSCKYSTILSHVVCGIIIIISLPIELLSAKHFKPYRINTVSYAIGYLHILFTLIKIWLNQIITISTRHKIIKHFNQALHINNVVENLYKDENLLDDKMLGKIKLRIVLFLLQCVAITFGVNAYISRSFFKYNNILLVRIFISLSYIHAIIVTTIYLGGSLMLCERYCIILHSKLKELMQDINGNCLNIPQLNDYQHKLSLNDTFDQVLEVYDQVILFIHNSHKIFASHAVICACSTFLISLHGTFTFYCSVRNGDVFEINNIFIIDFLITICYIKFKFIEFTYITCLSSAVKQKIEELHCVVQEASCVGINGVFRERINLLGIQMQQIKPNYKFCGMFEFDRKFMFSLVITVVSFLIILIQLDITDVELHSLDKNPPMG